ncbi:Laminin G domain [Trinorchestia longiramus]|nr:Laminin G domain [Trinorchestia longiramus]
MSENVDKQKGKQFLESKPSLRIATNVHNKCRCHEARKPWQCGQERPGAPSCHRSPPVTFSRSGFAQVALLFTPPSAFTAIQLRVRTRVSSSLILALRSASGTENLVLDLRRGRPCLSLSVQEHSSLYASVCLAASAADGRWHDIASYRYVNTLELIMDHGDGDMRAKAYSTPGSSLLSEMYASRSTFKHHRKRASSTINNHAVSGTYECRGGPSLSVRAPPPPRTSCWWRPMASLTAVRPPVPVLTYPALPPTPV